MIALTYAQAILNALFHTGGAAGKTAEEEMRSLLEQCPAMSEEGITPNNYYAAFLLDDYQQNGPQAIEFNSYRQLVDASQWFYTSSTAAKSFTYEVDGAKKTVSLSGWTIHRRDEQQMSYPDAAYLALFVTPPDINGDNYQEPITSPDGQPTTYIRVNLNESILTGKQSLNSASANADGGTIITNNEQIMYPDIESVPWGDIVGFGVFTTSEPHSGKPVLWGSVTPQPLITEPDRVPLFRKGAFTVTLK